ncbi:MAG: ABC transporter permease [Acidobacteriaceae bacterium]|nr:ABC transporter permease [Acidobacteriaceae bacterium]
MNKLVLGNILHRPVRTIISVAAVAIEIIMILSIVAIMVGMINDQKTRIGGIGADIIVQPPNASFLSGVSGAPVPAKVADVLRKLPHVAVAAPVITDLSTAGSVETIWGIDYQSYNALRPFTFVAGGPFNGPWDVIVDDFFARADHGHRIGDTIQIKGHPFRICGIVEHGKGGRKFVPIRTLGGLMGNPDNASLFYIRSDDLRNQQAIISEIHATPGLQQYQVQTLEAWMSMMTPAHLPGFNIALNVVISIAVIVGFLVIFQSLYTAVMERTREIGILKSMGASRLYIVNVVLREALFVAVAGIVLGIVCTQILKFGMSVRFPTVAFQVTNGWRLRGTIIALIGAVLGALYPAWKAASKDPIDALAYE